MFPSLASDHAFGLCALFRGPAARRTPLASLVAFLAVNFGAAIVLAALFGDKLAFVTDPVQLGIAVAVWYYMHPGVPVARVPTHG